MPTAATGRILAGRYRLISQLGVGGMGITYRAWDDVNAVPVVVKMPKREAQSDEEALRRFAREIDAMRALPHDHIVPITDHGEENGCPYVVMRFLPGGSLADHRRRDDDGNPLANPVGMLHFWLPAVAEALDFIHQKGVLHRDIKPGNIFFDGFWNAFLGDFGIAKVVDSSAGLAKEQTITATMIAIGTPEYMAPELFSPKGKPDGRADQYALAVTVYEMLCGVKPFTGAKAHIVVEHSGMPVPPLQNKGLGIPMSLSVAVERALAKTPPERFGTCAEFARAALRGVPPLPSEPDTARLMCPSCAKILRMPTSASGQWGKCPSCKVAMRVASGLSALWLRNEEFGNSDAAGDASVDTDFKESSEKPAGLFSKVPAVASWVSRKTREMSQKLMAIPPWASLALFIAGAALFLADRGPRFTDAAKVIGVPLQAVSSAEKSERAWQERAAAADAEIQSLRQRNEELQTKVDSLDAEVSRLNNATSKKSKPEEPLKSSLKTVVNSIGMTLVEIPAGKFHKNIGILRVSLPSELSLGQNEVTRGQWQTVMGTKPWAGSFKGSEDNLPATNISWDDVVTFCDTLTRSERAKGGLPINEVYRLPTEAEWAYACQAGTTTSFSFGTEASMLGDFGWFDGNAGGQAHRVGTKKPNPWGLHDMHGNVLEWCSDWYDSKFEGRSFAWGVDPAGPSTGTDRVLRGGSWLDGLWDCSSSRRRHFEPSYRNGNLGFRVARGKPLPNAVQTETTTTAAKETSSKLPPQLVNNSAGIELIEIPAGQFQMGEGIEAVTVTLSHSFWLGKTEVTRGQWHKVIGSRPGGGSAGRSDDDLPAVGVSWNEVTDFCRRLTARDRSYRKLQKNEVYRLPTEAEWEYACRAGTTTKFSFGDDDSQLGDFGWFFGVGGNSGGNTHPVGNKKPNPWGLYDMHGNVLEWCLDWYDKTLTGGVDPVGPSTGTDRVLRGGHCGLFAVHCSSRFRLMGTPHLAYGNPGPGFRLVRAQSLSQAELNVESKTNSEPSAQTLLLKTANNSVGMTLLEIPAGKFQMGEEPSAVAVTLTRPFWLGKTEVTRGQWEKVMGTTPWTGSGDDSDTDLPAVNVNWDDAIEFCEQLTAVERSSGDLQANEAYRLPTEAEWEYACRAGTTTAFSFGDDAKLLGDFGWFPGNSSNAHPVGTKKPNSWGLHDMHGNVWEWCSDWYDGKLAGGVDPVGPAEGSNRVSRGGSWRKDPGLCRSADRGQSVRSKSDRNLGFRVARGRRLQPVASTAATEAPKDTKQPAPEITQPNVPLKSVVDSVGIELLEIPAGKFMMGEGPSAVAVTLTRPFLLGKTEVTRGQWKRVMTTAPWGGSGDKSEADLPAVEVNWDDVTEFCRKLTDRERASDKLDANEVYRLPTEAEWEFACRAGTTTAYSFGDDEKLLGDFDWFYGELGHKAHPVGTKKPNSWGLYDMHGNVSEWCSTRYGNKLAGGVDPVGPAGGLYHVFRGGDCSAPFPALHRSASRSFGPSRRSGYLGFRVARGRPLHTVASNVATTYPKDTEQPAPEITQPKLPLKGVVDSAGIELLEIPAGKFQMGEGPSAVAVTLTRPFLLGKTEVTRGQWEKVMGTKPRKVSVDKPDDDLPAVNVSWDDATEFCRKLTRREWSNGRLQKSESYRLPTEAEWEYACRAGTNTTFSFGNEESKLGEFGWFRDNAADNVHPVATKQPNSWGLHDMHGNVWEWCSDWFDKKLQGGFDPAGPTQGEHRLSRGGAVWSLSEYCRSAVRGNFGGPSFRDRHTGFRVACGASLPIAAAGAEEKAATSSETKKPKLPLKKAVNTIGTEMLEIPAGTFQMGEEANSVAVTLTRPFWMGKTEVTQGQWKHVMGTSPWTQTNVTVADLHPAVNVKWEDVITFCETLTKHEQQQRKLLPDTAYRLPTEAEWEYVCRAGTTTQFSFGDDASRLGEFACFQNSSWSALVGTNDAGIVGARKPNPWGLHDMHGNVWEWCSDWYSEKLVGGVDPTGPVGRAERVYRGGGWWDPPMNCRSAYRNRRNPKDGYDYLGFRLVCGPTTPDSEQAIVGTPPTQPTAPSQKSTVTLPLESAVNGVGMEMVEIPATEYVMGEAPNSVAVKLTQPFWIGKTEVTQGQWKEVMGTEPWRGKGDGPTGANYPATHTSWSDAVKFCDKLTQLAHDEGRLRAVVYRLPTEAEWECACRAGTATAYSFGDNDAQLADRAWFVANTADGSHEVGAKPPNPWGLHDMHGNVREWCADWYGSTLKGGADPAGPAEGTLRVSRGGGWGLGAPQCTSSYRSANGTPATRTGNLGFRVACGSPVLTATRQQAAAAPMRTWYLADLSPVDSTVGAYQLEKGALATWQVDDRDVKKGFLAHAPSFIDFRMPTPKPSILRGAVGISRVNVNSRVRFAIFGNGKKLWESGVITQKPGDGTSIVEEFAVDLTRVSLLRLAVDPMGEINSDHSVWIDPVVELKTAPTTGSPKE